MAKANHNRVTWELLEARHRRASLLGYSKAKWIEFCETMLRMGFFVTLYEARQTHSKYITVANGGKSFKVRFSNHPPARSRFDHSDCDFFVGHTHLFVTNSMQAIEAIKRHFGLGWNKSVKFPAFYEHFNAEHGNG